MRHRRDIAKLGRPTDQRMAMLKNMVTQLLLHGKVTTTTARAVATKRMAEKTITSAKAGDLAAMRQARTIINNKDAFKKLFEEIVPKYKERNGGYLRVIKLPPRRGDAAEMALLTFVED